MSWGTELWDQFDNLDKHTQWGIDFLEKYAKFVKERIEIEQNYAKQLSVGRERSVEIVDGSYSHRLKPKDENLSDFFITVFTN